MEEVRALWEEFGDVPMNPATECIEEDWHGFYAGTHREDIWHWFEDTFNVSVFDLMYEVDEEDDEQYDDYDYCYECGGYGDDYFINDDGELECYCPQCSMNPDRRDEWDD